MVLDWYSHDAAVVHPLLVVLLALAIDAAIGDPPRLYERLPHPVALFDGRSHHSNGGSTFPGAATAAGSPPGCLRVFS